MPVTSFPLPVDRTCLRPIPKAFSPSELLRCARVSSSLPLPVTRVGGVQLFDMTSSPLLPVIGRPLPKKPPTSFLIADILRPSSTDVTSTAANQIRGCSCISGDVIHRRHCQREVISSGSRQMELVSGSESPNDAGSVNSKLLDDADEDEYSDTADSAELIEVDDDDDTHTKRCHSSSHGVVNNGTSNSPLNALIRMMRQPLGKQSSDNNDDQSMAAG